MKKLILDQSIGILLKNFSIIDYANGKCSPPPVPVQSRFKHKALTDQDYLFGDLKLRVRNVFDGIIDNHGQLIESKDIQYFCDVADRYRPQHTVSNGKLVTTTMLDTSPFHIPADLFYISFALVEFLSLNKLKYLKKCRFCKQYLIAKDPRRQYCYEPKKCKELYYNNDRKRRMREDYRNPDSLKFKVNYLR